MAENDIDVYDISDDDGDIADGDDIVPPVANGPPTPGYGDVIFHVPVVGGGTGNAALDDLNLSPVWITDDDPPATPYTPPKKFLKPPNAERRTISSASGTVRSRHDQVASADFPNMHYLDIYLQDLTIAGDPDLIALFPNTRHLFFEVFQKIIPAKYFADYLQSLNILDFGFVSQIISSYAAMGGILKATQCAYAVARKLLPYMSTKEGTLKSLIFNVSQCVDDVKRTIRDNIIVYALSKYKDTLEYVEVRGSSGMWWPEKHFSATDDFLYALARIQTLKQLSFDDTRLCIYALTRFDFNFAAMKSVEALSIKLTEKQLDTDSTYDLPPHLTHLHLIAPNTHHLANLGDRLSALPDLEFIAVEFDREAFIAYVTPGLAQTIAKREHQKVTVYPIRDSRHVSAWYSTAGRAYMAKHK